MPLRPEGLVRNAIACEADECQTWSRDPEAHGFLEIRWAGDAVRVVSFCSPGCALRWLATYANLTEEIPL